MADSFLHMYYNLTHYSEEESNVKVSVANNLTLSDNVPVGVFPTAGTNGPLAYLKFVTTLICVVNPTTVERQVERVLHHFPRKICKFVQF